MASWLIGAILALVLGLAATIYLWTFRRRDDEISAGLLALAGLRWRDFSSLVLTSLQLRGLQRVSFEPEDVRNQHPSFLLADTEGKHWLLSCKHGSAYRISSVAVEELASEARLRGAHRGILATEGVVDATGREKAERASVELLDGGKLWLQVKPMLDSAIVQRITTQANLRARRHIGLCWILALLLGVLVSSLLHAGAPETAAPAVAPAPASAPATTTTPNNPAPAAPPPAAPSSEEQVALQRVAVTKALAKAGGLRQPVWISSSTLSVDMLAGEDMVMPTVCAELAKYPDLALSRIQLNPAPGSDARVRWRQCEAKPLYTPASR